MYILFSGPLTPLCFSSEGLDCTEGTQKKKRGTVVQFFLVSLFFLDLSNWPVLQSSLEIFHQYKSRNAPSA